MTPLQPHTVKPKGAALDMSWRPLPHAPTLALLIARSTRASSYAPLDPTGVKPVILPAQSSVTSLNAPSLAFERMMTRLVLAIVGSVMNTYLDRYCCGGMMFTNSGSPVPYVG